MNLAWILLLAQMSSPARPPHGYIGCWLNTNHKELCMNSDGVYVPVPVGLVRPPKPEPMDVPAIKTGLTVDLECVHGVCTKSEEWRALYSCADKTRVLLTSEDGKKHCIKFPGE